MLRHLCLLFCFTAASLIHAASRPNIVFIMADDLGWADVAFHGGSAPTPHLDRLAKENLELTQHYVAPVCSPTRTGLMSGRYWSRFGITSPNSGQAMPFDTVTLPRALKSAGYDTCLTGKWHLGSKPEWGPNKFGFDLSYGSLGGGVGPYNHQYKEGEYTHTWHRDGTLITEEGHVTDLLANEAVAWISSRSERPFFLYVPFTAVHLPVKEPEEWVSKVPANITGDVARHYAACIMHMDEAIGQILAALEKAGKRDNTLVVFTSDNGGSTAENNDRKYPADDYPAGKITASNAPLRGQKADLYEGGIRVPTLVSWPGVLKAGQFKAPVHISDWMPTLCALAGYQGEADLKWDGINLWPALIGEAELNDRILYWTGPNFRTLAVREGNWKLIVTRTKDKAGDSPELFDLAKDPNETTNLAKQQPDLVKTLLSKMDQVAKADRDAVVKK
ncbi:arylsulfatase A-like enzyme [Prosthecobacter fusiformis]|uniref:Arylsulfatase A-like enzyme n=1 Tax=Prosthecobacter fusiformis TaxID=48464 RepID=A0A4V3FFJ4_9BACT|nr:sulfatase-like hydrolase/transferase [Prosthecobacter fusiformis]TDU71053.1 arylsulfatase A-like enzyme [Prosthecobacter fusiformis]